MPFITAATTNATDEIETLETLQDSLIGLWESFVGHLPLIGLGLLVLVLTWLAAKLVDRFSHRLLNVFNARKSLEDALVRVVIVLTWIAGLMLAAMVVFPGLDPADALAALGAGSIAIGFAFKDIFENFLAGLFLLAKMPFEHGDLIQVDDLVGQVEDITLRQTYLRALDGELAIIPNSQVLNTATIVKTQQDARRVTVECGVGYDEDLDAALETIKDTVSGLSSVRSDRPVQIFAHSFGASSMNFEITWWTGASQLDVRRSRSEVVTTVKRVLDDAGIEIPYAYRSHTFAEPLQIALQGELPHNAHAGANNGAGERDEAPAR